MNLLRNSIKSHRPIRFTHQNQGLSLLLRDSPRPFSTEAEKPSQDTPSNTGLVYGKLFGITNHTTKSDVINLLEGCKFSADDIKVEYNRSFSQFAMMIQFPSGQAYDDAFKMISRKGRLYRLGRADRSQWDPLLPYGGKAVLLQGIPRNALPEDVERFLSGCAYDSSTMQIFYRQAFPDPIRMAVVHFPSPTGAMHAFLTKNRAFCLNNQILVRVLQ